MKTHIDLKKECYEGWKSNNISGFDSVEIYNNGTFSLKDKTDGVIFSGNIKNIEHMTIIEDNQMCDNQVCDNTDCKNTEINPKLYNIVLTRDFGYNECEWCIECIKRDKDMIEYSNDLPIDFILAL